jgi:hypothetical protein
MLNETIDSIEAGASERLVLGNDGMRLTDNERGDGSVRGDCSKTTVFGFIARCDPRIETQIVGIVTDLGGLVIAELRTIGAVVARVGANLEFAKGVANADGVACEIDECRFGCNDGDVVGGTEG